MFNNATKGEKYFIFNINSAAVLGAVVYFDEEKGMPAIEYFVESKICISNNTSAKKFKENSKVALKKVVDALDNYKKINNTGNEFLDINKAFVFLAPPWVRKSIYSLVDERIKPFRVSEKYLENLLNNAGQMREEEDLIEAEIISIKANGYDLKLSDILEKEISKIDISLMDSYVNKEEKDFIENVIKETFISTEISFSAFLPVLFSKIKKTYDVSDDFAFMDFTGEVMEFGIYRDGKIQNFISIEMGKNKIIRDLVSKNIANNFSDAEYIFSLYLEKQSDLKTEKKVLGVIEKNIYEITNEIENEFKKYKDFILPKKVFIVSSGEMNSLLKDFSIFKDTYFIGKSIIKKFVNTREEKYFNNFIALEAEYIFN